MHNERDDFEFGDLSGVDPQPGWTPPSEPVQRQWSDDDQVFIEEDELALFEADDEQELRDDDPRAWDRYQRLLDDEDLDMPAWDDYPAKGKLGPQVAAAPQDDPVTEQMQAEMGALLSTIQGG